MGEGANQKTTLSQKSNSVKVQNVGELNIPKSLSTWFLDGNKHNFDINKNNL